jgi:hypothetical protein
MSGFSLWQTISFALAATLAVCGTSRAADPTFRLGPYPIEFEADGVKSVAWSHLHFLPIVRDRTYDDFRIQMTVMVQLNGLLLVADEIVRRKSDSCARYNVDNWTYTLDRRILNVPHVNTLRLAASGNATSWGCAPNPIPETVVDTCDNGVFQYPCTTLRPGSDLKTKVLYQTFDLTKDIYLKVENGKVRMTEAKEIVTLGDTNPLSNLAGFILLFTNTLPGIFGDMFNGPKPVFTAAVPTGFQALNPRYDAAGFVLIGDVPFAVIQASVGITRDQINEFMRGLFGDLWTDIPGLPPKPPPMTKALLKIECDKYAAGVPYPECAAQMGWVYDLLPD